VTSAGLEGRFLTDIDLTVDLATGDVRDAQARQLAVVNDSRPNPLPAQFPTTVPDQRLLARVAGWVEAVAPLANRPVGAVAVPLTRRQDGNGETALGDMVADGQLAITAAPQSGGAQMAIVNNGSLRNDLAPADGRVSYEQAFGVHPFGNYLVTLSLTGREIDTLLETQWQGAGSLLQVSSGLQFRWSASKPPGERIAPGDILLRGQPLQPDTLYRVTVTDFLAGGGDGYVVLKEGRDRVVGPLDVEALERYLGRQSPIALPAAGRITKLP
jgi:5'-nucleotidase